MTPLLHWALLTTSFVIVTLLGWLGLTVVLTAERRRWAVWLVSLAMFSGAAFFAVHAIVLCRNSYDGNALMMSEWPIAWVVGILQPCAWYAVVLWHIGFWENRRAIRHARLHTGAFYAMLGILGAATLLVANDPIISKDPFLLFSRFDPALILAGPYLSGFPVFALLYLGLLVLYTVFALDALIHPAPSSRMMGDLARDRARPWLMATSVMLLLVSLLVCVTLLWFMPEMLQMTILDLPASASQALVWIDLAVCLLVAGAVVFIGQAMVSYEIFTGKTLPRRGLRRSWRAALVFALGFSAVVALGPVRDSSPIYMALGMALIVTSFYAIYNARSFAEQERSLSAVRTFSVGPGLDDALAPQTGAEVAAPFHALCAQVLGVRAACLWPLGAHASLLSPLAYGMALPGGVGELASAVTPQTLCIPLEGHIAGVHWAVPLWGERGLCGLFLLGEKDDNGLFTQEEITVARTAGERMLDTLASAELARRLVQLQRARLAESQVVDRRTRRVLHDDVLPQVHTTMLALSAGQAAVTDAVEALADVHRQIANLLRELPSGRVATVSREGVLPALRQLVTEELGEAFAAVAWEIAPAAEARLAALPPVSAEVLYGAAREAMRNAARHGRGEADARPLHLRVQAEPQCLIIEDDGGGVVSPARIGGAGQGMMLHSTMMAVIGGAWEIASRPDAGTRVTLVLPPE